MPRTHTPVERRLKADIIGKNIVRRDLERSTFLIRRSREKLRKCRNHRHASRYGSTVRRHQRRIEELRVELLQRNADLEKRIMQEMKYSENEVEEFKTQLKKEIEEMEEARSGLAKIKAAQKTLEKIEDQQDTAKEITRATRRLFRETADVKRIEKEVSSEQRDEMLFTQELKEIEIDRLIYGE